MREDHLPALEFYYRNMFSNRVKTSIINFEFAASHCHCSAPSGALPSGLVTQFLFALSPKCTILVLWNTEQHQYIFIPVASDLYHTTYTGNKLNIFCHGNSVPPGKQVAMVTRHLSHSLAMTPSHRTFCPAGSLPSSLILTLMDCCYC